MLNNKGSLLIALLEETGHDALVNNANLQGYSELVEALRKDEQRLKTELVNDVCIPLNESIDDSVDLWNKQGDILSILFLKYAKNTLNPLKCQLNNLSEAKTGDFVLNGDSYTTKLNFEFLNDWAEGFTGDHQKLRDVYTQWSNTIELIDHNGIIKGMVETMAKIDEAIGKAMKS